MRKHFILGVIIFLLGIIFLINAVSNITGFIILEEVKPETSSFLALLFIIIGILLMLKKEGGLEQKIKTEKIKEEIRQNLKSGRIGSYKELEHYAMKLGYEIKEGTNHKSVYKARHFVTQIPRHVHGVATGTYRSILKSLLQFAD